MMKTEWKLALVVAALVMVLAAAGCTQPTPEEANVQLCADLAELDGALQDLENIDETATVGEVKAAEENVTNAWNKVKDSGATVAEVNTNQLEAAYNDLDKAVQDLPDDITIQEARIQLQPQIDGVKQAWLQVAQSANCE